MRLEISPRWRMALGISLVANLFIFGFTSRMAGLADSTDEVEYVEVDLAPMGVAGENTVSPKNLVVPPKQERTQPPPEPPKEEELGLAKKDVPATPPPTPSAAPAPTVFHPVSRLSRLPSFSARVEPVYPESERAAGVESRVMAEVYINERGGVDEVKITKSGTSAFDTAVVNALKASRFTPGRLEGREVAVKVQIPFIFKLK